MKLIFSVDKTERWTTKLVTSFLINEHRLTDARLSANYVYATVEDINGAVIEAQVSQHCALS
jgi:hypothetical protein